MKKQFIAEAKRLQKLAGIITENVNLEELPLTPKIKQEVDNTIAKAIEDEEMEYLQQAGYWENDFEENLLITFEDEFPNAYEISDALHNYIQNKVYEEDELNENKGEFNISNHKEEALSILNQFVDEFGDQFEFIPDLNNYNIDDSDNSLNVDELGSVFLIPNGSSLPNNIKQYIGSSKNGEVNDNGSVWKKYPKDGYYYIAMS